MKFLNILFISFTLLCFSCSNQYNSKDILVKGVVLDSQTGRPIPHARVTILCWRYQGWDEEETYTKKDTTTAGDGSFEARFKKGFKIDVGSVAVHYQPGIRKNEDVKGASHIELRLDQKVTESLLELGQIAVFVRDFDANPLRPRRYYGIDLLDGGNTASSDSVDIGVMHSTKTGNPAVLIATNKGGIIPIFIKSKRTSTVAPLNGYVSTYELNGKEKGFFVRCRDGKTYGRLMIINSDYNQASPYRKGSYKDHGIMFSADVQTAGREFNGLNDQPLDDYIMEHK